MAGLQVDKSKLFNGVWTTRDLAELFDVSPRTFNNQKERFMGKLKEMCDIEPFGLGKWFVTVKD